MLGLLVWKKKGGRGKVIYVSIFLTHPFPSYLSTSKLSLDKLSMPHITSNILGPQLKLHHGLNAKIFHIIIYMIYSSSHWHFITQFQMDFCLLYIFCWRVLKSKSLKTHEKRGTLNFLSWAGIQFSSNQDNPKI